MTNNKTAPSRTAELARFIVGTTFDDIPPAVVERAKNLVLHTIGVSLAALDVQQGIDAQAIARELSPGDGGEATLWGADRAGSLQAAAFLGGSLADLLDWEDCAWTGHPSAAVVPVAVSAAQAYGRSGKELIEAVVVAYEAYLRIGLSAGANIDGLNVFAATVAAAKLAKLNEHQVNEALSAAAANSAVAVNGHEATMSDALNYLYGLKAIDGVDIVAAIEAGFSAVPDAFDDEAAYAVHLPAGAPEYLTRGLGAEYLLMQIMVKHWPANMYVQTYAELAHALQRERDIDPDNIEQIILEPSVRFRHYQSTDGYRSLTQAQFSIPYVVAASFYHPNAGSVWYRPETLRDARVISLMNRVSAKGFCDESGRRPLRGYPHLRQLIEGFHPEKFMTVALKNGVSYRKGLFTHPGSPAHMFTREQFQQDFRRETTVVLTPEQAERVIEIVGSLETIEHAAVLGESLAHAGRGE